MCRRRVRKSSDVCVHFQFPNHRGDCGWCVPGYVVPLATCYGDSDMLGSWNARRLSKRNSRTAELVASSASSAARTKYHGPGTHSPGGWKSQIKARPGLVQGRPVLLACRGCLSLSAPRTSVCIQRERCGVSSHRGPPRCDLIEPESPT